ncbi:type I polyketide synthase [Ramlibacter sp. PS4R-6]|uniref:type I polyketide synthase n=1 Tax=Ramlibacter sp. PS4R-6 TaxID=3133438 RepID=UPI0030A10C8F
MNDEKSSVEPGSIAIVGIAGRFPSARTPAELWRLLAGGKEAAQWLTDDELRANGVADAELADPNYVKASLVLPDMEMFDADFFGFSKKDAAVLDPQHRHFLECCWEALEDAGHAPEKFGGSIGVFGGCGMQAYMSYNLLTNPQLVKSMGLFLLRHTGNDKDFLCTRVSYLLDLKGPSMSVQTACSTSLVAVHVAAQSLLSGECDMALAGGVSIDLPHRQGYRYAEGEILSPDGHCRAFDDEAQGTIFGSGAAVVVLRRAEDALRDGDNIYALIRGSAVNNDGYGKAGYLAPSVDGQAAAAAEALAVAGVEPGTVSYVEAHGTGTPVGDPIEIAALSQAYGAGGKGFCGIGSIKTNIGHLDTAAGTASLIKVVLAMRHGLIPPSLNFSRANSRMGIEQTPFQVMAQAKPWERGATPRRAGVNSLGVGGTNAHVIVEESPIAKATRTSLDQPQVFTFSARTPSSLDGLKAKWVEFLAGPPPGFDLADAAYTLQAGRREFEHRMVAVARDVDELRAVLQAKSHARSVVSKAGSDTPRVVFMFPGGGAHYPGAGRELLSQPAFATAVDECFAQLPADAPADLRTVMFALGDEQAARTLQKPRYAIPALFILEYAIAKLWASWGVKPAAVVGHSAGEYAAACLAGAMSLADALAIVTLRGQLFEQAPAGAMLSVDLDEAELRAAMEGLPLDVAAVNAPDLCIASGSLDAIAQLEAKLKERGLEPRRLHIDVAAHSRLLDGVLGSFRERVARMRFAAPQLPFISNVTGGWADAQLIADPEYWVRHLRQPVRFADGLSLVKDMPDAILIEVGPGQGLSALARQNQLGAQRMVLASTCKAQEPNADLALMLTSAGALWTRGLAPDWQALRGPGKPRRTPLPTYAFDHQRYWIEPGIRTTEAAQPAAPVAKRPALERLPAPADWFRVPQWTPSPLAAATAKDGEDWLVFGTDAQLTEEVVAQAAAARARVTLVRRGEAFEAFRDGSFTMAPAQADPYTQLLRMLEEQQRLPARIVHLWALETVPGAVHAQAGDRALAFDSLVHLARALQEADVSHALQLIVVSAGTVSVRGEAVPHAERALAIGPCRVIPRELPQVTARLIDFAQSELNPSGAAAAIVREAVQPQGPDLVAYRGGERFAQQLGAAPQPAGQALVRERGVYLITGGFGDIGLDLAAWLAKEKKARLALVGRRALPPRASWPALAASGDHSRDVRLVRRLLALEAQGAQVLALSADVADRRAMTRVIGECRARFGTINGVFHAAGVLEDAPIATKTPESIERVIGAKAAGAQVLHELLPPGDLDVFAVFSSTSVLLGGAGQVDYVAANAFLDALAASRDDGLAIRWGIWGDRGMAARAYGHEVAAEAGLASHPLLGVQVDSEGGATFEAAYDSNKLWVLREHRVGGRAVLPGTAYIEIARAAMMALHPRAAVEIRSLSFEEAMVFEPGETRVVRTELRRTGTAYEFTVRSRAATSGEWLEHAHATTAVFLGELAHGASVPATGWQPGVIPQDGAVDFGERWRNLTRMQLGTGRAQAHLELAPNFHDDVRTWAVHPALTDMAATFGLHLLDANKRAGQLFVPLSVDRIRIAAPLPPRIASTVKLRSAAGERLATFDVALSTETGKPLATFEGFSLRPVQPEAVSSHAAQREASLTDLMLACGIRGEDAPALFERILGGGARDLVVSSIDLDALARVLAQATPKPQARAKASASASASTLNPVEALLADVWRELLGVDDVAPDDDFFALGGHSLAAVRLFARIRKQYSVDLPLATLFQAPTLGALAALVAQHANIPLASAEPTRKSNVIPLVTRSWSPLVAICKGSAERAPLFCVHGAGGNVLNFKVISDRLGADQPFYGLQAQGVDGRLQPLKSVEEMARQYVEAIRTVQPRGPYQLAGYSAGGVIALEMAQQLKRDGAQVTLLAMIDTLAPVAARTPVPAWKKLWLARHWSWAFVMDWRERRRKGKQGDNEYAQALERLARGEPLPPELVEHHLFRNFVEAQSRYTPAAYDGDVVLFRATEAEMQYLAAGRTLGWEQHVHGAIRVTEVGGSHFSMMSEPGVSELIEGLRVELGLKDRPLEPARASIMSSIASAIGFGAQRPA